MAESITARSPKKMEVAVLLAIFLGPLGVFYSSIEGFVAACIVIFIGFFALVVQFEAGVVILFAVWPLSIVMAIRGVRQHNQELKEMSTVFYGQESNE